MDAIDLKTIQGQLTNLAKKETDTNANIIKEKIRELLDKQFVENLAYVYVPVETLTSLINEARQNNNSKISIVMLTEIIGDIYKERYFPKILEKRAAEFVDKVNKITITN